MKNKSKPGDLFNKFQKNKKNKKSYSESDMGSMKSYDPNLGLGKAGMRNAVKAAPQPAGMKATPKSVATSAPTRKYGITGLANGLNPNRSSVGISGGNANSTKMFKKNKKHKKSTVQINPQINKFMPAKRRMGGHRKQPFPGFSKTVSDSFVRKNKKTMSSSKHCKTCKC